jgi:hypothetical protein
VQLIRYCRPKRASVKGKGAPIRVSLSKKKKKHAPFVMGKEPLPNQLLWTCSAWPPRVSGSRVFSFGVISFERSQKFRLKYSIENKPGIVRHDRDRMPVSTYSKQLNMRDSRPHGVVLETSHRSMEAPSLKSEGLGGEDLALLKCSSSQVKCTHLERKIRASRLTGEFHVARHENLPVLRRDDDRCR